MARDHGVRRVIVVIGVVMITVAAFIVLLAIRRDDSPTGPAAPAPSNGPLVNFGLPFTITNDAFFEGAILSTTSLELYNSGTAPITVDRVEPLRADPTMSLVHVAMYSSPLNGGGWAGVQGWPPPPVDGITVPIMDITTPNGFPPIGRQLPLIIPSPHPPEMRTIVLAYRLEPPATHGEIHGVRITYTYEGSQYSLDASADLIIDWDPNVTSGTDYQPPSTSPQ